MKTLDAVDAGRTYRCLLEATANPGKPCRLPPGINEDAAETALLVLLDGEVTFSVVGPDADPVSSRLARATGSRRVPHPEADFVLVRGEDSHGAAKELRRGTLEAPEDGATVIYAVGGFSHRADLTVRLSGPGIPQTRLLGIEGLNRRELDDLRESRASYPLGIDAFLADGAGLIAGLPRSTQLEVV